METIFSKITKTGLFNIYNIYDNYIEIKFSNAPEIFIIDNESLNKIIDYQWYPKRSKWSTYCSGYVNKKVLVLHRYIMNAQEKQYVDHIDKNTFNTRLSNLRFVTNQQNGFNRQLGKNNKSGIMGVSWFELKNKWHVQIKFNYQKIYLGIYENMEDAIVARLKAEKLYFGEFSPQRHLFEQYNI
jgi:hypothetical protein